MSGVSTFRLRPTALAGFALAATLAPALAHAQAASVEDRLRALEQRQGELEAAVRERDARIEQLEAEAAGRAVATTQAAEATTQPPTTVAAAAAPSGFGQPAADAHWGTYEGGKGLVVVRSNLGELDFAVFSYARYLNQLAMDETYTDAFGRTKTLQRRNDVQFQKITMNFKGWLFDPDFRYLFYAWTSNTNQGLGAQVVLGGFLSYRFNNHFSIATGIGSLPTTRSTNWTFPNWLKVDNRTMADEYFRGSYTSGVWAWGEVVPKLKYRVMIGNNLSQLGVDASQLDNGFNTVSGALWWLATTGEYGPGEGFGDFENHEQVATLFGAHFTASREDAQSQPGANSFENSQIRLSDGTLIFSADPFGTGGQIHQATYRMAAVNAGLKHRGFSLDGEYYFRWVDDFDATGFIPVDSLFDHGFQLQGSAMILPKSLQAYISGSKIFGKYGDPWDVALGLNWYPFKRREVRVNTQFLYMDRSPVGYTSVPYIVGGKGVAFSADLVLAF